MNLTPGSTYGATNGRELLAFETCAWCAAVRGVCLVCRILRSVCGVHKSEECVWCAGICALWCVRRNLERVIVAQHSRERRGDCRSLRRVNGVRHSMERGLGGGSLLSVVCLWESA